MFFWHGAGCFCIKWKQQHMFFCLHGWFDKCIEGMLQCDQLAGSQRNRFHAVFFCIVRAIYLFLRVHPSSINHPQEVSIANTWRYHIALILLTCAEGTTVRPLYSGIMATRGVWWQDPSSLGKDDMDDICRGCQVVYRSASWMLQSFWNFSCFV